MVAASPVLSTPPSSDPSSDRRCECIYSLDPLGRKRSLTTLQEVWACLSLPCCTTRLPAGSGSCVTDLLWHVLDRIAASIQKPSIAPPSPLSEYRKLVTPRPATTAVTDVSNILTPPAEGSRRRICCCHPRTQRHCCGASWGLQPEMRVVRLVSRQWPAPPGLPSAG